MTESPKESSYLMGGSILAAGFRGLSPWRLGPAVFGPDVVQYIMAGVRGGGMCPVGGRCEQRRSWYPIIPFEGLTLLTEDLRPHPLNVQKSPQETSP